MNELIYFILASMALTLLPGPDYIAVVTLALTRGSRKAMLFALGLCSGLIFHILLAGTGLGLILKTNPESYQIVRFLGLSYLIFLGTKSIVSYFKKNSERSQSFDTPNAQLYRQGILMNVLNPKVTIFFLSFFPQFMINNNVFTLGAIFILQALALFYLTIVLAAKIQSRINLKSKLAHLLEGALFIGIALSLTL